MGVSRAPDQGEGTVTIQPWCRVDFGIFSVPKIPPCCSEDKTYYGLLIWNVEAILTLESWTQR